TSGTQLVWRSWLLVSVTLSAARMLLSPATTVTNATPLLALPLLWWLELRTEVPRQNTFSEAMNIAHVRDLR
ncbi:hypothetical protein BD289DRAFT_441059, partial [Coniella lustricola]